jgi:hypothetical protein
MLILLAAACVGGPASAQTWQPYNFPESGFTAQFPAQPTSAKSSYATLKGATVPAMTYAVEQDHVRYAVTVADFSQSDTTSQAAIDDAVKALSATGEVKVDVAARIDREFGRELSIVSKDGARTTAAVFFVKHKLYQLTGTALASAPQSGAARTTRFEETLEFDGEAAGRPENQPGGEGAGRRGQVDDASRRGRCDVRDDAARSGGPPAATARGGRSPASGIGRPISRRLPAQPSRSPP